MSKRTSAPVLDTPAPVAIGHIVRYVDSITLAEVEARVVEADGDVVSLVYRRESCTPPQVVEGVAYGPGQAGRWFRPGERPEGPTGPVAAGRPIVEGAVVCWHKTDRSDPTGRFERFEVVPSKVVSIIEDSTDFVAQESDGWMAHRFSVKRYSPTGFRSGCWSWPSDGVTAPPPREVVFPADRLVRCPVTGESLPAKLAVPIRIGPGPTASWHDHDGLVSPSGASQLRCFLSGAEGFEVLAGPDVEIKYATDSESE